MAITRVFGPTAPLAHDAVAVVLVMRDEADILPAFLAHYRSLDAARIIVIDHESRDGGPDLLAGAKDVVLYCASGGYAASNCGLDWSNAATARECAGRWVATVDADEFLLLDASAPTVARELRRQGALGAYAAMLDFFPEQLGRPSRRYDDLAALLADNAYFPRFEPERATPTLGFPHLDYRPSIRGALAERPDYTPKAFKAPLIYWRNGFRYLRSTHAATPIPLSDTPLLMAHFKHRAGLVERVERDFETAERLNEDSHEISRAIARCSAPLAAYATRYVGRDSLAAAGWGPGGPFETAWRKANRSREAQFERDAGAPMDADSLAARAALERVLRLRSWRASRRLRKWLHKRSVLHPDHYPEGALSTRDPVTSLIGLYESFWWDVTAFTRLPSRLTKAVRWRAFWRRMLGRRH